MLNALVLLDIPKGTVQGRDRQDSGALGQCWSCQMLDLGCAWRGEGSRSSCSVSTAQLREHWGLRGVKCSCVLVEALSNSLFYHSSECGRTSATPRWWERSGLRGLPCSSRWLQPRPLP